VADQDVEATEVTVTCRATDVIRQVGIGWRVRVEDPGYDRCLNVAAIGRDHKTVTFYCVENRSNGTGG
jgi:hypothetical protein